MKLNPRILIAVIATAVAIPLTFAAKGERKKNQSAAPAFSAVDKNKDGSISREEYVAAMKEKLGEEAAGDKFDQADKDKNGKLTEQEYADSNTAKKGRKKKNSN